MGCPHIGHAYESICCDVVARYKRVFGRKVLMTTGTDEHGEKVASTAAAQGVIVEELCEHNSNEFKKMYGRLLISYDDFIRTTEERHITSAQNGWKKVAERGDIYLGTLKGWYSVREERFIPEEEAKLTDYCDPCSKVKYNPVEEPSYFFKLDNHREKLIEHIETHPKFIMPVDVRDDILKKLKSGKIDDLSISRTSFSWGIPVPGDDKHVIYVWFDALSNFATVAGLKDYESFKYFNEKSVWPIDIQFIGKDISWFHSVILPCMLLAMDLDLPTTIFSHGIILGPDGQKMSKSLGNVINAADLLDNYGVEPLRYYIIRNSVLGEDMRFDIGEMCQMYNEEVVENVGGLLDDVLSLADKHHDGKVPALVEDLPKPFEPIAVSRAVVGFVADFDFRSAILTTIDAFKKCREHFEGHLSGSVVEAGHVRLLLESVYFLSHFLAPLVPLSCEKVFSQLDAEQKTVKTLSHSFNNLVEGTKLDLSLKAFSKVLHE
ncbi:methionyl-tRNA synthetase, putative [Theileria equi strain WA]|uniref:methionine--tRNA ligase n=1 Tax=Theileria equi strain WA TaxID=1537102 RepID=L1LFY2_THEEQ|nr:methionyl-tRNA synthetase, putative [Theileria equi strain WA]EKX74337.1 methionyl-tRNA synthetase, putative [Theileria equi strain WA]|eukprot:XP_004833789.1 methionyl-tRNA synthetase, putative [Theileria equi strain WA]